MYWLLVGYMYLFIHRPFEIWPFLGTIRLELLYMLFTGGVWLLYGGKRWLPNPLNRAFLALAIAVVVCWLASPWSSKGFDTVDRYLKQMVFYVLLVTAINDEETLRRIGQAFLIIMTLYMIHSLIEFTRGRYHYRMETTRLIGVDLSMSDPNAFGSTLVYCMALVPAMWYASTTTRWRGFLVFYSLLSAGCIALTGSRSSFACLGLLAVLTIMRSRWRYTFAALGIASAPVMWSLLPHSLQNRFETIINPDAGPLSAKVSAQDRLLGLRLGAELFERYPLTGCGPGVWIPATKSKIQSHNLYGQVIGELGLIGTLAFASVVLFFWLNVRRIKRLYREHPEWGQDLLYHFAQSMGAALLLLLIFGNVAHNLFRYHWLWYGAFLIVIRHLVERRVYEAAEFAPAHADADWDDSLPVEEWTGFAAGGSHA